MRADHDIDRAVRQPLARLLRLRRGHEPRQPPDLDREALEARDEIVVMLSREQCRRTDDRDLLPRQRSDERGAQRDLGLAEADIADDQPVHRLARRQIDHHVVDRAVLIVGLLVREAVDEAGIAARVAFDHVARPDRTFGGDRDQFSRDLADALLHLRLATLPRLAAQPVERGAVLARSVARQDFEILDGDEQFVATGIFHRDAVVRALADRDRGQPLIAADAVIHMDDQIARRQRRQFGQERVRRFLALAPPDETIAEHVLFGQDRDARCGEAVVERQDDERDRSSPP